MILSYYLNDKFSKKNALNGSILKCKPGSVGQCFGGSILGFLLIAGMWAILYLIYPFDIIRNPVSKIVPVMDIVSYSLGNTLEELLFRGFLLLASVRLFEKTGAVLFVSILFGLFHLPGFGLTKEGLSMAVTTFTMSLLYFRDLLHGIHLAGRYITYHAESHFAYVGLRRSRAGNIPD